MRRAAGSSHPAWQHQRVALPFAWGPGTAFCTAASLAGLGTGWVLWWPGLLGLVFVWWPGLLGCIKQHSYICLMGCSLFYLLSLARLLASDCELSWIIFPSPTCPFPAGMDLAGEEQDPALAVALRAVWCALPGQATCSSKSFSSLLLNTTTSALSCLKVFSRLPSTPAPWHRFQLRNNCKQWKVSVFAK